MNKAFVAETAMPQPVFDVLTYPRNLESTGLSRQQAEAIARGMTLMVTQQVESLVTKEHFDLTLAYVDQRFQQVDQRFDQIDNRFEQVNRRFEHVDGRLDRVEDRLSRVEKSLSGHTILLSIITFAVVTPLLQSLVTH
ncbi:MAG: CCDC90 family protein [Halieaceae bacterium]|jgi:uncharacterized protein YpuA (DUF1002 family)|uniref:hypothetical protein n=1 Tax=Haliea alexandrii TaxID=2448162 RepID=UPI000F0BB232|nr:hypothetical protein [Haliea alexandrii]MCR9186773.1 CCDC90 family protein [Halieaceae bacterium]